MVLRIASITALALAAAFGTAQAQMAPAFQAPPPVFVTTIRAQLFCGEAGRCPQRIYRTVFQTLPNGDVYATDSGLTYPLNRTEVLTQPPPGWATVPPPPPLTLETLFQPPTDLGGATEWVVASTFAGNVLSLFYTSEAYRARSRFKMRLRFHHGTRYCEVLAWEHGGQRGRFPLAQAYIDGKCEIPPPPSVAATARPRVQKARPVAKAKEPACVDEADTPCPALK